MQHNTRRYISRRFITAAKTAGKSVAFSDGLKLPRNTYFVAVQTAAITAGNCTIQLMSVYLVAVIAAAETAAKCNMLLAVVVPAVTKNRREMSPDTGIHGRFQTAAQMISRQLEPPLNDLKTAVKCMFTCSMGHQNTMNLWRNKYNYD